VERENERDRKREEVRDWQQAGRKSETARGVDSTSDFEQFVLPGSAESLANAAG